MSSVALAVSLASSLTSLATTAKPLPASPARAASIVAFSASRLVCCAIEVMTLMTLPISALLSPSLAMVSLVVSADLTAVVATRAASAVFLAISLMLAPISSAPVATVCTLLATCSDGGRDHVGLGGGFLGAGAHLLADFVQFLGRRNQRGGIGPDLLHGLAAPGWPGC